MQENRCCCQQQKPSLALCEMNEFFLSKCKCIRFCVRTLFAGTAMVMMINCVDTKMWLVCEFSKGRTQSHPLLLFASWFVLLVSFFAFPYEIFLM